MPHLIKLVFVVLLVVSLSAAMSTAHGLALEDALLDRLDKPAVSKVVNYLNDTWVSRTIGFSMLLTTWTAIVFMIDRFVDPGVRNNRRPSS